MSNSLYNGFCRFENDCFRKIAVLFSPFVIGKLFLFFVFNLKPDKKWTTGKVQDALSDTTPVTLAREKKLLPTRPLTTSWRGFVWEWGKGSFFHQSDRLIIFFSLRKEKNSFSTLRQEDHAFDKILLMTRLSENLLTSLVFRLKVFFLQCHQGQAGRRPLRWSHKSVSSLA